MQHLLLCIISSLALSIHLAALSSVWDLSPVLKADVCQGNSNSHFSVVRMKPFDGDVSTYYHPKQFKLMTLFQCTSCFTFTSIDSQVLSTECQISHFAPDRKVSRVNLAGGKHKPVLD